MSRLLTTTFTTADFVRSSLWLFVAFPYRTAPKGPPSSFAQHNARLRFLDTTLRSILFSGTSSLLRVIPPLCSASGLSSLWVHHLDFSVRIAAAGSHVPHNCLLTDSGHLNAGCRSVRKQVSAGANPTATNPPWFRHRLFRFDMSSVVPLRSSFCLTPDLFFSGLFLLRSRP